MKLKKQKINVSVQAKPSTLLEGRGFGEGTPPKGELYKKQVIELEEEEGADPELQVFGYGRLRRSSIRQKIEEYLVRMLELAQTRTDPRAYEIIEYLRQGNGVLEAMLKTEIEHAKEQGELD